VSKEKENRKSANLPGLQLAIFSRGNSQVSTRNGASKAMTLKKMAVREGKRGGAGKVGQKAKRNIVIATKAGEK